MIRAVRECLPSSLWQRCQVHKMHDVPNLFIGDSSVFATGAALTISALATGTAEGMINTFERGELRAQVLPCCEM